MLSNSLNCIVTSSQESQLFKNSMDKNGEEFSFMADFVSKDTMHRILMYQQQESSKMASDSFSYSGDVADLASRGQTSSIGE